MQVGDFAYVEDLILRRRVSGEGRLFLVDREYRSFVKLDGIETKITVPAGMATDLASIPACVPNWIARKVDAHIEAAIVHDFLCVARPWTYKVAADIFNAAMRAAKVPSATRELMYRAVLYLGPKW